MRHIFVIAVLVVFVLLFSIMVKRSQYIRREGNCLYVRAHKLRTRNKPHDMYIPQCTILGNYFKQQCSTRTQSCWCVDYKGEKIVGTEISAHQQPVQCHLNWFFNWYRRLQE